MRKLPLIALVLLLAACEGNIDAEPIDPDNGQILELEEDPPVCVLVEHQYQQVTTKKIYCVKEDP